MKSELQNKVIYQVYVRNYTKAGTFKALIKKLDYIKSLGIDIIYLLPIHEIGQKGKKGSLGCPYSIKDYYSIAQELGTLNDFKKLIKEVHNRDMKIMMDVVFNHTSRDSILIDQHPDWYWKNKDGELSNRVGDWTDVYDLNHDNLELEEYLSDNVKYWADLGVDAFRFDVASILPLRFYKMIREKIGDEIILLAESVDPNFIKFLRTIGATNATDSELYEYFDLTYPYDIFSAYRAYFNKPSFENKQFLEYMIHIQGSLLPQGALKINCLENHDQPRIASFFKGNALKNVTALSFFLKGTAFIYGGQEVKEKHLPSLFEKETINLKVKDKDFLDFIKNLINFKHNDLNKNIKESFIIKNDNKSVFTIKNIYETHELLGLFNVSNKTIDYKTDLRDGEYVNLLNGKKIIIKNSIISIFEPIVLKL